MLTLEPCGRCLQRIGVPYESGIISRSGRRGAGGRRVRTRADPQSDHEGKEERCRAGQAHLKRKASAS